MPQFELTEDQIKLLQGFLPQSGQTSATQTNPEPVKPEPAKDELEIALEKVPNTVDRELCVLLDHMISRISALEVSHVGSPQGPTGVKVVNAEPPTAG